MFFVTIVGKDKCGKTSIINHLKQKLNKKIYYFTREPRFFEDWKIKNKIVKSRLNFLFFFIDRVIHKLKLIKHRKKIIISDRSIVCGIAYAYATGHKFNLFFQTLYYNKKWLIPYPKVIIYIDPNFTICGSFNIDFVERVVKGYYLAFRMFKTQTTNPIWTVKNNYKQLNSAKKNVLNIINKLILFCYKTKIETESVENG